MIFGLVLMIVSEAGALAHIEPFWSWTTPIAWTGFILFADDAVWRARGNSWIRSDPQEFLLLSAVSIPLWLVFEFYNQFLNNWFYAGLPENTALRLFGYAWSFSTIWPAIFEGAELVAILRAGRAGRAGGAGRPGEVLPSLPALPAPPALPAARAIPIVLLGALMLAAPFVVAPGIARYLAAPVWIGFILVLDPINARIGGDSLAADIARGQYDRIMNLAWSGVLCGVLWEFWNYGSRSQWHYTVPFLAQTRLFEMPLPGYLGYPAFALECFTMYVFVRATLRMAGRAIAL